MPDNHFSTHGLAGDSRKKADKDKDAELARMKEVLQEIHDITDTDKECSYCRARIEEVIKPDTKCILCNGTKRIKDGLGDRTCPQCVMPDTVPMVGLRTPDTVPAYGCASCKDAGCELCCPESQMPDTVPQTIREILESVYEAGQYHGLAKSTEQYKKKDLAQAEKAIKEFLRGKVGKCLKDNDSETHIIAKDFLKEIL
jgi:hypothetical protein